MSTTLDKVIKLLAQTDGRDKIYKFLAGFFKILSILSASRNIASAKAYASLVSSIGSARSLMRMGRFVADVPKLESVINTVQVKGPTNTEIVKYIEFFRTLGNSLYIIGDNIAFAAKHHLVALNDKKAIAYAKIAQFYGFLLATILDLINIRKILIDDEAGTNNELTKNALITLSKDSADLLVCMAAVGYLKQLWNPSGIVTGALTAYAGGVATYLNWNKIKEENTK